MAAFNMSTFTQDLKAWAKDKSFPVEAIYDPTDRSTVSAYLKIGEIYNKVVDWLNTTNHYGTESMNNVFCVEKEQMNSMLPNQNHSYGTSYDELYAPGTSDYIQSVDWIDDTSLLVVTGDSEDRLTTWTYELK